MKHAHNILLKKRLNEDHFRINKDSSADKILNIDPDDFKFPDKYKVKREELRAKFLKKYKKMKSRKKKPQSQKKL